MKVRFYAAVPKPSLLELVEFYRQDLWALRRLGHDVAVATRPHDLLGRTDVIWAWWPTSGCPAILSARALRVPSVLVSAISDNDATASGLGRKRPWTRAAARVSLRLADLTLATSEDTRRGLERYRPRRLATAPLGVDTDFYRPDAPSRSHRRYVATVTHLTVDNIERKRVLDVVRTAALVAREEPDIGFFIVGPRAAGAETVEREIDRLAVRHLVRLTGEVTALEKRDLLAGAAVYLQPTHYEGFGLAIAEAMACGTPVLSHGVGNLPDLVGPAGVLLPSTAGPAELASQLLRLVRDRDSSDLGRLARRRIEERFTLDARLENVRTALERVI